jgi:hypothetical protein
MEACDGTCSLFKIYTTALLSNSDRPALFGSCAARVSNADISVLSAVVRVMLGSFIHDRGRFWQRSRDSGFCLFGLKKAPSLETCAREYLVASGYVTHGAVIITMVAALCVCLLLQIQSNAAPPPATTTTSPQEAEKKTSAPAAGRSNSTRPGQAVRAGDGRCMQAAMEREPNAGWTTFSDSLRGLISRQRQTNSGPSPTAFLVGPFRPRSATG